MNYKFKYEAIKPFINFKFDMRKKLTPAQKALITKYYNALFGPDAHTNKRGYELKVYRPKSKKNLALMKEHQDLKGLGKLKAVPVMVVNKKKARVRISGNKLITSEGGVKRVTELFNLKKLVRDSQKEVDRITSKYDKKARFSVLAGQFEIVNIFRDKGQIGPEIKRLMNKYQGTYKKWLKGVAVYTFDNQLELSEYRQMISTRKLKRKRKNNGKKKNSGHRLRN